MAFEVVRRKPFVTLEAIAEDQIALQRSGVGTVRVGPLAMVGVTDKFVALADSELMRIGIRRPHEDEGDFAFHVQVLRSKGGKDTGRRHVNLAPAIRRLGLEAREVSGRYSLLTVQDVLFVTLSDLSTGDRVREAARQKRAAQIAKEKKGK